MTTRIIDVRSATLLPDERSELLPFENIQWISVLKSLTAYQMYRRHVGVHVRAEGVVSFLLNDPHFPRTVQYCLNEIESGLGARVYGFASGEWRAGDGGRSLQSQLGMSWFF